MEIILASASPRRKELITKTGVTFKVIPSECEEFAEKTLKPEEYAAKLAEVKARDVASRNSGVILGADTVVVLDGKILGKPKSAEDAAKTLRLLSGKIHTVITGYCVIYGTNGNKTRKGSVSTKVYFNELSEELIDSYVSSGKCMDKAGSYGIQDGFPLVNRIDGSLSNVIGLPVEELTSVFKEIENERC